MNYTIIHISDLHKGENADLNNLFSSLIVDCEKYTQEGIQKPSIIVVSGDVVNGAEGPNAIDKIRHQYEEVSDFLEKLVDYFLDKDKSRLIIVPGNHDMCRVISDSSMTSSSSAKEDDLKAMKKMHSNIRWSWNDFGFFNITKPEVYANRFSLFVEFYNHFYQGLRVIDGIPDRFSDIVDLPEYGIAFALFNSCYNLDHLNHSGAICPSAVTKWDRQFNDLYKQGRLLVAVWHHHTMGLPPETNYLDYRILQTMLANHIHVGLYGHQHKSQVINNYSDIDEEQSMVLICSGSLYGQRPELATGNSRQYNLIAVETSPETAKLAVNVRSDQQPDYDIPLWSAGTIGKKGKLTYDTEIKLYTPSKEELLMEIDDTARKSGDYNTAVKKLTTIGNFTPKYNEYLDEYLLKANLSYEEIVQYLTDPNSETQALMVIDAALNLNDNEIKSRVKSMPYIQQCSFSSVKEFLSKL